MSWDNPFRLTNETITNPLTGRTSLYPDNHANYLNFAAGTDLGKYLHVTASITSRVAPAKRCVLLPYTSNTAINTCGNGTQACNSLAVLPAANLGGDVQTLAMNYNVSTSTWKNLAAKVNYRYYDWSDNTNSTFLFTPVQGDASAPASADSHTPFGFTTKHLEFTGYWYFAKRSSLKAGYDALWTDRSNRDVAHSLENSFFFSGDWSPLRSLLLPGFLSSLRPHSRLLPGRSSLRSHHRR